MIFLATQGVFYAGGIIGCGIVAWLADKQGRKLSVQIITIVYIVSAAIQASSVHIAMLLVGRFFNGLGSGMINAIVPLYQSEVSPPKMRGRMVGSHGFLIVVGYVRPFFICRLSLPLFHGWRFFTN